MAKQSQPNNIICCSKRGLEWSKRIRFHAGSLGWGSWDGSMPIHLLPKKTKLLLLYAFGRWKDHKEILATLVAVVDVILSSHRHHSNARFIDKTSALAEQSFSWFDFKTNARKQFTRCHAIGTNKTKVPEEFSGHRTNKNLITVPPHKPNPNYYLNKVNYEAHCVSHSDNYFTASSQIHYESKSFVIFVYGLTSASTQGIIIIILFRRIVPINQAMRISLFYWNWMRRIQSHSHCSHKVLTITVNTEKQYLNWMHFECNFFDQIKSNSFPPCFSELMLGAQLFDRRISESDFV